MKKRRPCTRDEHFIKWQSGNPYCGVCHTSTYQKRLTKQERERLVEIVRSMIANANEWERNRSPNDKDQSRHTEI